VRTNGNLFTALSNTDIKALSMGIFGASVSLLGFVLAAGTFLISHAQNNAFEILRKSKSFCELQSLISSSIWRLFWVAVSSLLIFFTKGHLLAAVLGLMVFLIVIAGLALAALMYIIIKMLGVPLGR